MMRERKDLHYRTLRNRRRVARKSRRATKRSRRFRRSSSCKKRVGSSSCRKRVGSSSCRKRVGSMSGGGEGGLWSYRLPDEAVVGRTSDEGVQGFKTMEEVRQENEEGID